MGSAKFKWASIDGLETLISQKLSVSEEFVVLGVLHVVQGYWHRMRSDIFSVVPLIFPLLLFSPFSLLPLGIGMSVNMPCDHCKSSILALSCLFFTVPVTLEVGGGSVRQCSEHRFGHRSLRAHCLTMLTWTNSQTSASVLVKCLTYLRGCHGELYEKLYGELLCQLSRAMTLWCCYIMMLLSPCSISFCHQSHRKVSPM